MAALNATGRLPRRILISVTLLLLGGLAGDLLHAQAPTPDIAELRQVIAVRDAQAAGTQQAVVEAARSYLEAHADGKYGDEVLLALAAALADGQQTRAALEAYNRVIADYPDSPFREQAMSDSLPLLMAEEGEESADARLNALMEGYPNSLQRTPALIWKAQTQYDRGAHAGVVETLELIDPQLDLSQNQEADFYRLQTLALVKQGQSAWTPLNRYLKRKDSAEHKAEVLMLVGEIARNAERPDEALGYYRQVVEDYPVPQYLGEALFRRAQLFHRTRLSQAQEDVRAARRETAIGYYSTYLEHDHPAHRAEAHLGRGALYKDAGRLDAALRDFNTAVELNGDYEGDPQVVRQRVALLKALERPLEAVRLLAAARETPGLSPEGRTALQIEEASMHYDAERCERVEALLNPMPIISDRSARPRAFFIRGFCRYRQGLWEKATFDLEGLINDPDYQNLVMEPLLDAYEKSGQASRLVNLGEELLKAGRVEPSEQLLLRLAGGYEALGEPALMLAVYQRLEALNPEAVRKPELQFRMGKARELLGLPGDAALDYRRALELLNAQEGDAPPLYMEALERLHHLYVQEARYEELTSLLASADSRLSAPEDLEKVGRWRWDMQVDWGRKALREGEVKLAAAKLEEALADTPPEAHEQRAQVVALLVAAHAQSDTPERSIQLYESELRARHDPLVAAQLTAAVLTAMKAQSERFMEEGKRGPAIAFYRRVLDELPRERAQVRYETGLMLDRLYQREGDFAARAALLTALRKDGLDDDTKRELRLYQSRIYTEWGAKLLEEGEVDAARFNLERAFSLLGEENWRQRYEVISFLSRIHLQRKEFTDLVLRNEAVLPRIEDDSLAGQLRHFLGQVYLEWGKAADEENNLKSSRIRYYRALDYLPTSDWQRRLVAAAGLAATLRTRGQAVQAARILEAELPRVEDRRILQQYALYLGRLYREEAHNAGKASKWLKQADLGAADPLSLEAGYLLADLLAADDEDKPALEQLRRLAARDVAGSKWEVPIHYRLAVLHHKHKRLKAALPHYRIVAGTKAPEIRQLYPRAIRQSRVQVRRIESYLNSGGGRGVQIPLPN